MTEQVQKPKKVKVKKQKLDRNELKSRRIDSRPFSEINTFKIKRRSKKKKRVNRTLKGDITLFVFLAICGSFSLLPLILTVNNAFKPLDEIFLFPPRFFVKNPTLDNFSDLINIFGTSLVPISRYFFNTIFVTLVGTVGHVIIASMCAYPLAKRNVPGGNFISKIITLSLLFNGAITAIPLYLIFNEIHLIDKFGVLILPAFSSTLGLFLMKQFMTTIPTSLIESAKIDGAGEFRIFWQIIMPLVKPAWLTLIILCFQQLWLTSGSTYIYSEQLKMVGYALNQIATAGPARQGTLAAVSFIMILVPVSVFILSQTQIMDTMAHSGMK